MRLKISKKRPLILLITAILAISLPILLYCYYSGGQLAETQKIAASDSPSLVVPEAPLGTLLLVCALLLALLVFTAIQKRR